MWTWTFKLQPTNYLTVTFVTSNYGAAKDFLERKTDIPSDKAGIILSSVAHASHGVLIERELNV